jgi:predicted phosphodiesterase
MDERLRKLEDESLEQYKYRLSYNKDKYGLSWSDVSELIFVNFNKKLSKDFIRHEFYGMKQKDKVEDVGVHNRILVVSDQHYPYNLPVEVLKDYENKVDILVFNGDEQDCQGISKFSKKYRIPFVDEMIGTRQMIIDTIELIKPKKVILNYGNHNERLIRYFTDRVHEDLLQLMPNTNLDFIVDLGFWQHNHQTKSKTFYEPLTNVFSDIEIQYTKNWWCKVGKTIFAHPKAYKSGILGTVEKAYLYFLQLGEEFDSVVMAHTHQSGITRYGKSFLIDSGSLCKEQEYATSGNMNKPQSNGFVYIVQDENGNFVYDKSKLIFL